MLTVVQHQQHPAPCAVLHEGGDGVAGARVGEGRAAPEVRLARPEAGEDGGRDIGLGAHRGEFDEPGLQVPARSGLQREPGLAHAAGTDEGEEPLGPQLGRDVAQFRVPAQEGGERGRQRPADGSRLLAGQQLRVQGAEFATWFGAQAVREDAAHGLARVEALRRAPRGAQGTDPQRLQRLVQGVLRT
ncbi:hypothetical protein ACGF1Z_13525 [Streptomyces sp. NPDC048018]|uniref:hypothetical protein n=1 Tax=Streptomyces sp. NPDC048018 TaxID=3365499 RepID=UPI003717F560